MTAIFQPVTTFTDKSGDPLDNGSIYLGTTGLDARTNPITAYRDSALTIPWTQPIRTVAGYPAYQGAPAKIYIAGNDCSMTVLQNDGQVVFNNITASGILDGASAANYVTLTGSETLTNKTLTTPIISATVSGITAGRLGYSSGALQYGDGTTQRELVDLSRTQTLTNKTLTAAQLVNPVLTGTPVEDIYTIADGAAFEIDPANGSMQHVTLGANRTPKGTNFLNGQAILLSVDDGTAYTITWTDTTFGPSGVKWLGGSAPTLATSGLSWIVLWKRDNQVYGAYQGAST